MTGQQQHSYRALVRGRFDGLDERARSILLAEVDEHGLLQSGFTEEGTLTYDSSLTHFTFRYLVVSDAADGAEMAAALAGERAELALRAAGYGYRGLRAEATDLDTMKVNRKGR